MNTKRYSPELLSGSADNNEHNVETLIGTTNVRAIMSTDLNDRSTAVPIRRKNMFKRFRRWTGKKLTAICSVCPGRQRTSSGVEVIKMDTNRNSSELSTGFDDNDEHQIHRLSGTINVTAMMSTDSNERSTAVPSRRKGVFKRFRRWTGKISRTICCVEVMDNNENKPSNNDIEQNTNNENVSKIIEATVSSLTTSEPETVINSAPTDQHFANVENDKNTEPLYDNLSETQTAPENVQIRDEQNSGSTAELFISEEDQLDDLQIINLTASRQVDLTSEDDNNNRSLANVAVPRYQKQQQQDSITKPRSYNKSVEASTSNGAKVEEKIDPVFKCWKYRYNLFSKFDDGIMMDRGSFFSVCPELISKHIAVSCRFNVAINPFCGVGGIAIQLAMVCESVIAMDIDANKIKLARYNATLYGVQHKIQFVVGDFFATGETMKADIVVTSPAWGRGFWRKNVLPLRDLCRLHGGAENIMRIAKTIAPRVLIRLPTNASIEDCVRLGENFEMTNIEKCSLDGKSNCLIVRFCSLTSWYDVGKIVCIDDGSGEDERNNGKSLVRRPRFCNTLVRLRSTGIQFFNRQREKESYFKEYIDSVMSFLATNDTNHAEPQNN